MKRRIIIILVVAAVIFGVIDYLANRGSHEIVITGVVTTEDVIVGPEVQGQLAELDVNEGDTVKKGQLLGKIRQQEWMDNRTYFTQAEEQAAQQVKQAQATQENTQLTADREADLFKKGVESQQSYDQARTANDAAIHQVDALKKQWDAAKAQSQKAQTQFDYTEVRAPIDGVVDFRAAREGEVVNMGQAIVTLINEDGLWVRADVEETYITSVHLKDKMTVRLPDGTERTGTVIFIGKDADYATQRDVSRTKRDIKTFEIRLSCDNKDRNLALGMTAYVVLPLKK